MTELILIRHGETAWNSEGRFQGHTDIALSEVGKAQALAARAHVNADQFAAIYCSDLSRTQETATLLFGNDVPLHLEPRLREIDVGDFSGRSVAEVRAQLNAQAGSAFAYPGGESLEQFGERVAAALHDLAKQKTERPIAVVTHGGVVRMAVCLTLGLTPDLPTWQALAVDNLSFTSVVWGERRQLRYLNRLSQPAD